MRPWTADLNKRMREILLWCLWDDILSTVSANRYRVMVIISLEKPVVHSHVL